MSDYLVLLAGPFRRRGSPSREEIPEREFQPECEQQKGDSDLGQALDVLNVGDGQTPCVWPKDDLCVAQG